MFKSAANALLLENNSVIDKSLLNLVCTLTDFELKKKILLENFKDLKVIRKYMKKKVQQGALLKWVAILPKCITNSWMDIVNSLSSFIITL